MDVVEIEEMFAALGAVTVRRMFGGKGIYHQGLILAVELDGEILLKADAVTHAEFEAAGARRWTYDGQTDRPVQMPYWSIPDAAYDDPDAMARWVRLAFEAALRSPPPAKRAARGRRG